MNAYNFSSKYFGVTIKADTKESAEQILKEKYPKDTFTFTGEFFSNEGPVVIHKDCCISCTNNHLRSKYR